MADMANQGFGGPGQRQTSFGTGGDLGRQEESGLAGVATAVKDTAQNIASSVASRAEDAWDSTRQGVQQAASAVTDTASDAWGELTGLMRRYPFGTFFVGLGLGFLLARLFEARSLDYFGHMNLAKMMSQGAQDWNRASQFGSR